MERMTIDVGIDLGTTTSCIAVLEGVNPRVIRNNESAEFTPSAVSYAFMNLLCLKIKTKGMM